MAVTKSSRLHGRSKAATSPAKRAPFAASPRTRCRPLSTLAAIRHRNNLRRPPGRMYDAKIPSRAHVAPVGNKGPLGTVHQRMSISRSCLALSFRRHSSFAIRAQSRLGRPGDQQIKVFVLIDDGFWVDVNRPNRPSTARLSSARTSSTGSSSCDRLAGLKLRVIMASADRMPSSVRTTAFKMVRLSLYVSVVAAPPGDASRPSGSSSLHCPGRGMQARSA